jgi:hypothetical protein
VTTWLNRLIIALCTQELSLLDVRKEITFCRKVQIPIIGVVENMSGFVCPSCKVTNSATTHPPLTPTSTSGRIGYLSAHHRGCRCHGCRNAGPVSWARAPRPAHWQVLRRGGVICAHCPRLASRRRVSQHCQRSAPRGSPSCFSAGSPIVPHRHSAVLRIEVNRTTELVNYHLHQLISNYNEES